MTKTRDGGDGAVLADQTRPGDALLVPQRTDGVALLLTSMLAYRSIHHALLAAAPARAARGLYKRVHDLESSLPPRA